MNKIGCAIVLLMFAPGACLASQGASESQPVRVDLLQVTDLPLSISMPVLEKSEKGPVLKCSATNNTSEQMFGVTLLILVLNADSKVRAEVSWTQRIKMASYDTQDLSFRVPLKLQVDARDHIVLAIEQVFGHDSIWRVPKAQESAEAYAQGDPSVLAKVQRTANEYDPRMPLSLPIRVIY